MNWLRERFELSRGGERGNVRAMEGMRGFAVVLVFLVHYVMAVQPYLQPGTPTAATAASLRAMGNCGVDLFFVLSGYLIYGSLISRAQPFGRFFQRRLQRIYPAFLAVFALYLVLSYAIPSQNKIPLELGSGLLYVAANLLLLPGLFPIAPIISVAWSLSYEMFFYLVIPIAIAALSLRRWPSARRAWLFALLSAALVIVCALFGGPVRLIMFLAGMLVFELVDRGLVRGSPSSALAAALLVGGLLFKITPGIDQIAKFSVLFFVFGALCWSCFARPRSWLSRAFTFTPLRWLGNMSYSYYLLHGLAVNASFMALGRVLPAGAGGVGTFLLLLPPVFAAGVVVSAALFLLVERPLSLAPSARLPAVDRLTAP